MTNLVFFHSYFFFILLEGINTSFKWLVLLWQDSNLLGNLVSLCTSFFPENDSDGRKYYIMPPCLLQITNSLYSQCKISTDYPILLFVTSEPAYKSVTSQLLPYFVEKCLGYPGASWWPANPQIKYCSMAGKSRDPAIRHMSTQAESVGGRLIGRIRGTLRKNP